MQEQIEVSYFPFWKRYAEMIKETQLTDAQLGKLIRMMIDYQFRGELPEKVPMAMRGIWLFIRKDLDDARRKYESCVCNGKKGGRKKKVKPEVSPEEPKGNPKEPRGNPEEPKGNPEKAMSMSRSRSMSRSMTESMSRTDTVSPEDHGSAPDAPVGGSGISPDKHSFGEFGWVRLTSDQYQQLEQRMGREELEACIRYVDESAQSTHNRNRWEDWYLVLRRCHEQQWHSSPVRKKTEPVPMGATGYLGEAELEAIRRVLAEE